MKTTKHPKGKIKHPNGCDFYDKIFEERLEKFLRDIKIIHCVCANCEHEWEDTFSLDVGEDCIVCPMCGSDNCKTKDI